MSLAALEQDIRRLPGVVACQFTTSDVFVLVEPSADPAAVTGAVTRLLDAAAEARRIAVLGGSTAAASGPARRWGLVVAGTATASALAVASVAGAATGVFRFGHSGPARTHAGAAAPAILPPAAPERPARRAEAPPEGQPAPAAATQPPGEGAALASPPRHHPRLLRLRLPAPLPALAAASGAPRSKPAPTTPTSTVASAAAATPDAEHGRPGHGSHQDRQEGSSRRHDDVGAGDD